MTSYASLRSAVDSMKSGAVDYIAKPFDHDEMIDSVGSIIAEHSPRHSLEAPAVKRSQRGEPNIGGMIGSCRPMLTLYDHIAKVAPTETTVLVRGETGTGKELVARAIHSMSNRVEQPLVCVNCAAIPETLIESEPVSYTHLTLPTKA